MIADMTGGDLFEIERTSGDYRRVYPESAEELKSWTKPVNTPLKSEPSAFE